MRVRRFGGGIVHRRKNGDRMGLNVTVLRTGELALAVAPIRPEDGPVRENVAMNVCPRPVRGQRRAVIPLLVLLHLTSAHAGAVASGGGDDASPAGSSADGAHPAKSLTAQAGDPTAPLMQIQFTDFYSPDVRNSDGYANLLNFQPVVPVPAGRLGPLPQVMRLTVPYVTTPDPERKSGLGDVTYFDIFVVNSNPKDILGVGFTLTMPTASDSKLGSGSWQLGPAASWVSYEIENWQIGAIVQNPISVAGEGNRDSVNTLEIQPIVNYLRGDWYLGAGDFNLVWDWKSSEATIPVAFQVGKIQEMGRHKVNLSAELEW
ncbi:MAG: hypothetical protein JJ992_04985, partial [Planctomycetes bacterium]|nr:hypothetical protein [Planctomycetota bacterium]